MSDPAPPVDHLGAFPVSDSGAEAAASTDEPWLVIRNPVAGDGRAGRSWQRFERALRRAGVALQAIATTATPGDATRIAQRAATEGVGRILVAGGDGTAHEVVNGWMLARAGMAPGTPPPVVVPIPLGTGNDWARSLGLALEADHFAAVVAREHHVAWHDVGRMQFGATGAAGPRWFVNVAGAGFDAEVIAGMGARASSRFGYLLHALRSLRRYRSPAFHLEVEGHAGLDGRLLLAFVALGQYCGHRMHVAPQAVADDGLFELVAIADVGLARALPKLVKLYRGTLPGDPLVRCLRAPALRVTAEPPAPVEADGQLVGVTPVAFDIEPRGLRVLRRREA